MWNIDLPPAQYLGHNTPSEDIQRVINEVYHADVVAIDTETTGLVSWKDIPLYWSLAWGNQRATLHADLLRYFTPCFRNPNITWTLANAKYDMHILANFGHYFEGRCHDVSVMHALLYNAENALHGLKPIAKQILNWTWADFQDQFGKISKTQSPRELIERAERENFSLLVEYASNDAWGTLRVYQALKTQLQEAYAHSLFSNKPPYINNQWDFFSKVESPYTKVLWKMERRGIKVNRAKLEEARPIAEKMISDIERELVQRAGTGFNPASSKQVGAYAESAGLKVLKRSPKTGAASWGEEQLKVYAASDRVVQLILEHHKYSKLLGTYIVGIHELLDPYDRVHSHFNQDVARTGRLSCVAEWTPLRTRRGSIPIKDVRVGDEVLTHKKRWRRVTRTINKGPGLMYDVRFSNGEVLTCTTDHRLLTSEGWQPLGVILEHLQEVGLGPEQPNLRDVVVQVAGVTYTRLDCGVVKNYVPQRFVRGEQVHGACREESPSSSALLTFKDGVQEPNEGEDGREPPQLERLMRRWVRVPDVYPSGEKNLRASHSDHGSAGSDGVAGGVRRPSHRRGQKEQRHQQPGVGYAERSSYYSLPSSEGLGVVSIEEVVTRGVYAVLDITVDEDSSYEACGVFSHNSSDPNLQNIPRPENDHWALRDAFISEPGWAIMAYDYSQLEMRLLAAAAREQSMVDVFLRGWDIHAGNAHMMYGQDYEDLNKAKDILKPMAKNPDTAAQIAEKELPGVCERAALAGKTLEGYLHLCAENRTAVKSISFGLNYGMGEESMASSMKLPLVKAREKIAQYKAKYPAVDRFMLEAVEESRVTGYAFTVMGRRRDVMIIMAEQRWLRAKGERLAVNHQIQGSAADVVKMAQIGIDTLALDREYDCWSVLQVHDELVFECPKEVVSKVKPLIEDVMAHPFSIELMCPLEAEGGHGDSWGEAK